MDGNGYTNVHLPVRDRPLRWAVCQPLMEFLMSVRTSFSMLALWIASTVGSSLGADWQVGLARVDITPEKPIRMAGYGSRTEPSLSVSSRLWAKAIAFMDTEGQRSLLLTADTLGFPQEVSERICARIQQQSGLERSSILLNGSHTHAGPLLTARSGYSVDEQERTIVLEYQKQFEDRLVRIAIEALGALQPAELSWGIGVASFVMNRREFTPGGVILGVNPSGHADRRVPVLQVNNLNGERLGIVFGTACHNTTLTGKNRQIDGDFAGHAQLEIERRFPGVQAMFVIGCAGDANPFPRSTMEFAKQHGQSLGAEVVRVLSQDLEPITGPLRTELRWVDLPLRQLTRSQIEAMAVNPPSYLRFFTAGALERLERGEKLPTSYRAPFALWQFGESLTLVGLSGETVVDYVSLLEEELGPLNLWVAGYCNDVYGYLVTTRLLEEGGYETRGLYTDVGLFAAGVERPIVSTIRDMAQAAGRPMGK